MICFPLNHVPRRSEQRWSNSHTHISFHSLVTHLLHFGSADVWASVKSRHIENLWVLSAFRFLVWLVHCLMQTDNVGIHGYPQQSWKRSFLLCGQCGFLDQFSRISTIPVTRWICNLRHPLASRGCIHKTTNRVSELCALFSRFC
jgi:hypothetical protein